MHSLTNTTHHCLHCLGTIATTSRVTQLPLPLTSRHRHAVCGRHTGCAPPGGRSHRHVLRPSCAASPLGASANPGNRAASAASTSLPIRIIGIGPRAANVLPRLADPNTVHAVCGCCCVLGCFVVDLSSPWCLMRAIKPPHGPSTAAIQFVAFVHTQPTCCRVCRLMCTTSTGTPSKLRGHTTQRCSRLMEPRRGVWKVRTHA
jgi:hypothetical protein